MCSVFVYQSVSETHVTPKKKTVIQKRSSPTTTQQTSIAFLHALLQRRDDERHQRRLFVRMPDAIVSAAVFVVVEVQRTERARKRVGGAQRALGAALQNLTGPMRPFGVARWLPTEFWRCSAPGGKVNIYNSIEAILYERHFTCRFLKPSCVVDYW